ncbi:MAG: hypothetical protein ACLFPE_10355 [Bacteroidales bacterium]
MEPSFHCPFCHGQLYVNERIVLSAQSDKGLKGLILLTPDLGDYRAMKHPSFKIEVGEHVDFFCPICHANLIVERKGKKFTHIMMLDTGEEFEVLFSQIAGEKCTYVVGENSVKAFGEDADANTNFWGAAPSY